MYYYYQIEGGEESWKVVPASDVAKLKPHMFRTVLALDATPTDTFTKENYAAIKYSGPLYFDLDDQEAPGSTAKDVAYLIDKLVEHDVNEDCIEVFASGGKGFHVKVYPEVFIEKVSKTGYQYLPTIYKEFAFEFATRSTDLSVYTARKGRMLRVENVQRPNGLYKVQLTVAEVRELAALPSEEAEERYKTLCSTPRTTFEVKREPRAFGLQALFDTARKKVDTASKRIAKMKPVELPDELPSFEAMLRGEGIRGDVGFHPIAMQLAITAHQRGMSAKDLVEAAEGLVQTHQSDGRRYDTPDKRRRELARMWDYTEDNPCYQYAAGAIRSLLTHTAPDLAGAEASAQEIQEEINNPSEEGTEFDHAGVILTEFGVSIPVEGGVKKALAMGFVDTTEMVSASSGKTSVMQSRIKVGGRDLGVHTLELDMFNSASSLNKAVMPFGQVFAGSDPQARGLYLRLMEKARKGGRRVYVLNREGVDIVKMPFHSEEDVRKGVLIYADREAVLRSVKSDHYEDFNMKFVGYPNPIGIFQSDLSLAPRLGELTDGEKETMRETLWHLLQCQTPDYLSKLIGWNVACHYRMLFHTAYGQFPLLHVAGAAGAGKTQMCRLLGNLHYYSADVKMLTPTSTNFAIKEAVAASASIPLILDEFKPHELPMGRLMDFRLMFRDAYNCREVSRGGGSREVADFRVLQTSQLSAPICFISEAAESEPAVMERVVLLTLVKPPAMRATEFFEHYDAAGKNRKMLGILGAFIAKSLVNTYTLDKLVEDFDPILNEARKELMFQPGDENLPYEQKKAKISTKERTVFNYAVLRFGLLKFTKLVEWIFKTDLNEARKTKVFELLDEMYNQATSTVAELQTQTAPEWMKVFNTFSLMAAAEPHTNYHLRQGRQYEIVNVGDSNVLEISPRECYVKYRLYCSAISERPLFPSEQAFIHGISSLPSRRNSPGNLGTGQTLAFDLDDLRMQGFVDMPSRG